MIKRGKSINLFLMDGDSTGRIKCTLANWTGIAYKIPRIDLDKSRGREDLKQSGVYFLFGIDEENGKNVVYIGQAGVRKNGEGILNRLFEHKRDDYKSYWNEAVVFTTSNNSFGPTEISYLENRFCILAIEAGRYEVKNGNEPSLGNITEEKESELEEFIDYAKVIMGALGFKVFVPLINTTRDQNSHQEENNEDDLTLYLKRRSMKSNREIRATCTRTNEGFVVLKDSMIELINSPSLPNTLKEIREITKIDRETGILQEDVLFNSPSYASAFILGMATNGRTDWKTKEGITLKDLEERDIEEL